MKIKESQLRQIIKEEIMNLFEQPNVAPTSHFPDVTPTGGGVVTVDAADIDRLDSEIKSETDDDEELIKKAEEVGVDPMLVGDFGAVTAAFMQALMDFTYEAFRAQNQSPPPGVAEE